MASNVTGDIFPVRDVVELAHRYDALCLIDAAQSAGLLKIDVEQLGADFLAFAGHKGLLGPPGLGGLYVAPGERHMLIENRAGRLFVRLDDGPAENFCKPAVDPMLRIAASTYGPRLLSVILTGMGDDGAAGLLAIKDVQGHTVAQDEATCVIYGMPKEAIDNGAAAVVLPLNDIAAHISEGSR